MSTTLRSIGWVILGGALLAFSADGVLVAAGPSRGPGGGGHSSARSFSAPSRSFSAPSRSSSAPSRGAARPSSGPSMSRMSSNSFRGGSPGGGAVSSRSFGGSARSMGHMPSLSAGSRSPVGPSSSFRSHNSPGSSISRGIAGPSNSSRFHSSPSSPGSHSVARPSGNSYRPQWQGGNPAIHSDRSPQGSHGYSGRSPDVRHGDAYRDLTHRGYDNDHRYQYPYRYGYNDWNRNRDWYHDRDWWRDRDWYRDRDWWRPYHGYLGWNVIWPLWHHRWYAYYPGYRTSYYLDPYYYGYPYAGYYGYPDAGYYDYADAGFYGSATTGFYDGSNSLYYSAGYAPTADAATLNQEPAPEPVSPAAAAEPADAPAGAEAAGDLTAGQRFFSDALTAFQRQDYRQAARMANHAMIEMPQEARVHELLSLSLFALGDYRGATMEAHAALAQGTVGDWARVYAYYQDQPTYAKQLGALEQFLKKNPSSLDARFVLGYHYVMLGHLKEAKEQLAPVVSKAPWDTVAVQLFKKAGGETTALPPTPSSATPAPSLTPAPNLVPKTPPKGPSEF